MMPAAWAVVVLLGISSSAGLGERPPGLVVRTSVQTDRVRLLASLDTTPKYTGRGDVTALRVDTVPVVVGETGILVGGEVHLRRGGDWEKQTYWLRVGLARTWQGLQCHLTVRRALAQTGVAWPALHETAVDMEAMSAVGRFVVQVEGGVLTWRLDRRQVGYYGAVLVGVRLP